MTASLCLSDILIQFNLDFILQGMELKALLEGQRHEVWCSSESCDMSSLHSNGESDLFDDDGTNCEAALGTAGTSAPITRNDSSSTYGVWCTSFSNTCGCSYIPSSVGQLRLFRLVLGIGLA